MPTMSGRPHLFVVRSTPEECALELAQDEHQHAELAKQGLPLLAALADYDLDDGTADGDAFVRQLRTLTPEALELMDRQLAADAAVASYGRLLIAEAKDATQYPTRWQYGSPKF